MRKNKIYLLLFILGLGWGIFFGLNKVKACSPEVTDVSEEGAVQPESTPSVYYDEYWQATRALVYLDPNPNNPDNAPGFADFTDFNEPTPTTTTTKHKMVVTKWRVHGHIHTP